MTNSRQTCCADSGSLFPDPECRPVYFQSRAVFARGALCPRERSAQRRYQCRRVVEGDVCLLQRPNGARCVGVGGGLSICRLFFRARLTQTQGKCSGHGRPLLFLSAGVVDFLPRSGLAASCSHFQLHTRRFTPARSSSSSSRPASLHVISLEKVKRDKYLVGLL